MKLPSGNLREFDSLSSTQDEAKRVVEKGESVGIVLAHHQTRGRGRRDRSWFSAPGESLTASLIFDAYADHPEPWLVGMATAIAVAESLEGCLQWPNDVLLGGKKVAGVLTEMVRNPNGGLIPVVGVGINLNQTHFPSEIAHRATSLRLQDGEMRAAKTMLNTLLRSILSLPEPTNWLKIASRWQVRDNTPGKEFRLESGEIAIAVEIGTRGELICQTGDEKVPVFAADAFWPKS